MKTWHCDSLILALSISHNLWPEKPFLEAKGHSDHSAFHSSVYLLRESCCDFRSSGIHSGMGLMGLMQTSKLPLLLDGSSRDLTQVLIGLWFPGRIYLHIVWNSQIFHLQHIQKSTVLSTAYRQLLFTFLPSNRNFSRSDKSGLLGKMSQKFISTLLKNMRYLDTNCIKAFAQKHFWQLFRFKNLF